MRTPSRSTSSTSATPRAKARATSLTLSARRSLSLGERSLESLKGYAPGGRTTAPTTMGPAQAPRPASSRPATLRPRAQKPSSKGAEPSTGGLYAPTP